MSTERDLMVFRDELSNTGRKLTTAFLRRQQKFAQSSSWFGYLLSKRPNKEEDFANFCGLLRKAELYLNFPFNLNCLDVDRT